MKKEAPKIVEQKETLPEVMNRYGGMFSIETKSGFAHLKFEADGEMYVTWLNDEGYVEEDGQNIPFKDIERVANFMREMKELRLPDYQRKA